MVRLKRLDANLTSGLLSIALFVSNYILPLAALYAVLKLLQYFLVKDWDLVLLKAARDG